MKKLSRYLIKTVANSTLSTLMVLLALQFVFALVEEVGDFGQGDYNFLKAVYVIALTLPHVCYEMLPMALLMGTLLGLGGLATNSELVAMRAAGVSVTRITFAVMQLGLFLLGVTFFIGEVIVPKTDLYAQRVKTYATEGAVATAGQKGVWLRAQSAYLHIDEVFAGGYLRGVDIFELDKDQQLVSSMRAEQAIAGEKSWQLQDISLTVFSENRAHIEQRDAMEYPIELGLDVLSQTAREPSQLPVYKIPGYIRYFEMNGLETAKYELAFWLKIIAPFSNLVMVMLAAPFAFGSLRNVGNGQRMVVGVFIGLGYALFGRMINHLGLAYDAPPLLCAATPFVIFLVIALINLRRTH